MNTLILYETRSGFTEQCAKTIHTKIPGSVLKTIQDESFAIEDFDIILIGAPIYEGEIDHYTKRFLTRKKLKLIDKKLGIFCAGMNIEEFNLAVQESIPPDIFYHAQVVHCGGKIEYKNLSLKEKFTVRRRLGIKDTQEIKQPQKLEEFIKWAKQKETT